MKALVLRLDGPMMSFGAVMVDHHGYIDRFPGTSMLCGLIANALGWDHSDVDRLQALQERIRFAARWDVSPERVIDYHTVDLGQCRMREEGWTTRGEPEHRAGGTAGKSGTHERYRHYWNDGVMTLALGLTEGDRPSLEEVKTALERPARPLFLGRKSCLTSRPLLDPETPLAEGNNVLTILRRAPVWTRAGVPARSNGKLEACWPAEIEGGERKHIRRVYDLRDWPNQLPAGGRWRAEGLIGGRSP
ncbi:MAG: type I-E CRISPR-associated protein Cas5/CasD [Chloroflexota bacterium]